MRTRKANKVSETIITKGKILTADPIYNDILNREPEEIKNKKVAELADKVTRIESKIGGRVEELNKAIEESRNKEKALTQERERERKRDAFLYLEARAKLDKQEKKTQELIKERDALIDKELSADDYMDIITTVLSEYDKDREKRKEELIEHLVIAEDLLNESFNQCTAFNRLLSRLAKIRGTKHEESVNNYKTSCRNPLGSISVKEDVNTVRNAHTIRNMVTHIK